MKVKSQKINDHIDDVVVKHILKTTQKSRYGDYIDLDDYE